MRYLLASLFIALTGCGSPAALESKPVAPIAIEIEPRDEVIVGRVVDFAVVIEASAALSSVRVSVDLPEDVALFSGDQEWSGSMQKGERRELVFALRIPEERGKTIRADALARVGETVFGARAVYYVNGPAPRHKESPEARDGVRDVPLD